MARPGRDEAKDLERRIRMMLLGIVAVVSLVLLGLWRADNPRLERLRMAMADAAMPGLGLIAGPLEAAAAMARDYRTFIDVYQQNRTLRREIERLEAWRDTARALEEENAQLRALMNVRLAPRMSFVTGDVIADSGGPFSESALVNVGARDGVVDGSAAVDGSGLVGRVVGVGENAARLMLLTDFSSRVPVVIQPSGRRAILAGDATHAPRLEFLDGDDAVRPGDTVETSGDGGVFPPNLPVGRLVYAGASWRAALSADYARLEFVRLLRYRPDRDIDRPGGLVSPGNAPGTAARRRAPFQGPALGGPDEVEANPLGGAPAETRPRG
ncbi:MAG: rod shape-determining protein MreC [Pseudomonadota bacterium]